MNPSRVNLLLRVKLFIPSSIYAAIMLLIIMLRIPDSCSPDSDEITFLVFLGQPDIHNECGEVYIECKNAAGSVKFDIANLYVKVPSGSNRLFICPLDVFSVLYCHQPVSCALVT